MSTVRVRVEGVFSTTTELRKIHDKITRQFSSGVRNASDQLLEFSREIVPIWTKRLSNSAGVIFERGRLRVETKIVYRTEYAVEVHQDPRPAHGADFNAKHVLRIMAASPWDGYWFNRRPQEQAKFLDEPARDKQKQKIYRKLIVKAVRR